MARTDVEYDDLPAAGTTHQLLAWHVLGLAGVVPAEVGNAGPVGASQVSHGHIAHVGVQARHVIAGEAVVHARTFLTGAHQPSLPQRLQMHRYRGHPRYRCICRRCGRLGWCAPVRKVRACTTASPAMTWRACTPTCAMWPWLTWLAPTGPALPTSCLLYTSPS